MRVFSYVPFSCSSNCASASPSTCACKFMYVCVCMCSCVCQCVHVFMCSCGFMYVCACVRVLRVQRLIRSRVKRIDAIRMCVRGHVGLTASVCACLYVSGFIFICRQIWSTLNNSVFSRDSALVYLCVGALSRAPTCTTRRAQSQRAVILMSMRRKEWHVIARSRSFFTGCATSRQNQDFLKPQEF